MSVENLKCLYMIVAVKISISVMLVTSRNAGPHPI